MAQTYNAVNSTDTLTSSRQLLIDRDDALRSSFSGTSAPASPVQGQLFFNTSSVALSVCTVGGGSPTFAGVALTTGATFSGDIAVDADNSRSLGAAAARLRRVYTVQLFGTAIVGGSTTDDGSNVLQITGSSKLKGLLDLSDASTAGQIKFPATQNASADANTLDDYEEGTWTPSLKFGGAAVGMSTSIVATYTKVGRKVTVHFDISLTTKGSSTGNVTVEGLPFATIGGGFAGLLIVGNGTSITGPACENLSHGATTTVALYNGGFASLTDANLSNGSRLIGSLTYNV